MLKSEKGTSALFTRIDKVIQVYNVRISSLISDYSLRATNINKKIQKDIEYKDGSAGPPMKKVAEVSVNTNIRRHPDLQKEKNEKEMIIPIRKKNKNKHVQMNIKKNDKQSSYKNHGPIEGDSLSRKKKLKFRTYSNRILNFTPNKKRNKKLTFYTKCSNDGCEKQHGYVKRHRSAAKASERISHICRACSQKIINHCRKTASQSFDKEENCKRDDCRCFSWHKNRLPIEQSLETTPVVEVQNQEEQTGDPLFEIKVDNVDMCVLNSSEIKDKVLALGKKKNLTKCICPSHPARQKYILAREACPKGTCYRALRHKKIDFACKCLKNRVWSCTDTSCNKAGTGHMIPINTKPLFEVQVNKNDMCIVNTKEIRRKIQQLNRRSRKHCRHGICKEKSKERNTQIDCKCTKNTIIDECAESNCGGKMINTKCCKCQRIKMVRGDIDIPPIKNIGSRLSNLCCQIMSKSENWTNHFIKRKKRNSNRMTVENDNKCQNITCSNSYNSPKTDEHNERPGFRIIIGKKYFSKKKQSSLQENGSDGVSCSCGQRGTIVKRGNIKNHHETKAQHDISCRCYCECEEYEKKRKSQTKKKINKLNKKLIKKPKKKIKKKSKKKSDDQHKRLSIINKEKRKAFIKEQKKMKKLEEKRRKMRLKEEQEVLQALESQDKSQQPNCAVLIIGSILSAGLLPIKGLFYVLFKIITDPKGTYWYTKERWQDREGTMIMIRRYFTDAWRLRKLKICKCLTQSENVNILADTFQETALYQAFADKGRTKKEQARIEMESKRRRKRVRLRRDFAIYGCRHMLLTTLRKVPCLWFYHIFPDLYPQCLNFLTFIKKFTTLLMFTLAFVWWTPCILCFELTRALCCCLLCTG